MRLKRRRDGFHSEHLTWVLATSREDYDELMKVSFVT